jgi:hypothetical protein
MFFCVFAINFNQGYDHLQAFEYNVQFFGFIYLFIILSFLCVGDRRTIFSSNIIQYTLQ